MIGFFIFDEQPSLEKQLVSAHAKLNERIKGYFYARQMDTKDVSSVYRGSEFFGVLDDASGYGACLFVKDLASEKDTNLIQHNEHVKGNLQVDGNTAVAKDLTVGGQITGLSNGSIITLDPSCTALIVASGLSGTGPISLANVIVQLMKR